MARLREQDANGRKRPNRRCIQTSRRRSRQVSGRMSILTSTEFGGWPLPIPLFRRLAPREVAAARLAVPRRRLASFCPGNPHDHPPHPGRRLRRLLRMADGADRESAGAVGEVDARVNYRHSGAVRAGPRSRMLAQQSDELRLSGRKQAL